MKETSEIKKYKAIDFFCGGGGMTCGLRQAGIDVIAGVDLDENAKETYEFNNLNCTPKVFLSNFWGAVHFL